MIASKKLILFSILFLSYYSGKCQNNIEEIGNFKFDKRERKVSWLKVFEPSSDIDFPKIKNYFTQNQILEITLEDSTFFNGKFNPKPIDIQKYGLKRGMTPMFLLDVEQIFNVKLEFKEGRYRVILSQMGYIDNGVLTDLMTRSLVGNTATTAKGNLVSYDGEFSYNNKNEVRKNLNKAFEILDRFYSDTFEIKESEKESSDW